jgi:hypothetical protein
MNRHDQQGDRKSTLCIVFIERKNERKKERNIQGKTTNNHALDSKRKRTDREQNSFMLFVQSQLF